MAYEKSSDPGASAAGDPIRMRTTEEVLGEASSLISSQRAQIDKIKADLRSGGLWAYGNNRGIWRTTALLELAQEWVRVQQPVVVLTANVHNMVESTRRYLWMFPEARKEPFLMPKFYVYTRSEDDRQFEGWNRGVRFLIDDRRLMPPEPMNWLHRFEFWAGIY